ncbi:MAG: 2-oxoacid:acceptor oxidoreductase family protein [Christensenella sp.]|nr:2-oxoacid:acceptor oxidoreductase family protein [Christensenella sp.]
MDNKILFAGFGGQGILFSGKVLAQAGLIDNKEISWLPSYGPEMRGGTANCSVMISDTPVGSPIVSQPTILIAMNKPSLFKYLSETESNGQIFYDSSLIEDKVERADVSIYEIPATQMASDNSLPGLANMIILGKVVKESKVVSYDTLMQALTKVVSTKHADKLEMNKKAIDLGFNY